MEEYIDLLMVKSINGNLDRPGNVHTVVQKVRSHFSARGMSTTFLDEYCRYCPQSHFLYMREFGLEGSLVLSDIFEIAEDFVRRVRELCFVWKIELTESMIELERQKYQWLVFTDQVHSAIKLQTNFVFCDFNALEVPPGVKVSDFFPRPLSAKIRRLGLGKIDSTRRIRNQALVYTIFQGFKKGLPGGLPSMVAKSLKTHHKALSTPAKPIPLGIADRIDDLLGSLAKEFQCHLNPDALMDNFTLGVKSTLESSLAKGGEVGYCHEQLGVAESTVCLGYVRPKFSEHLMEEDKEPEPVYATGPILSAEECYAALPRPGRNIEPRVAPSCVIEPLKVRIITKPQVGVFARIRMFQKQLWNFLANHKSGYFDLIGESLTRTKLWKIVHGWTPGKKFCSGDYSAATDNLKSYITERIMKFLFNKVYCQDDDAYEECMESMLHNTIEIYDTAFPKDKFLHLKELGKDFTSAYVNKVLGDTPREYKQQNGQLMGNVLSFPILCVANYLAYHISVEIEQKRRLPLWKVPEVLINGDDILFMTDDHHYLTWKIVIETFGFFASQGKNLLSDRVLQINSKLFFVSTTGNGEGLFRVADLIEVPFVNFGLVTFRGKQDCSRDLTQEYNFSFDLSQEWTQYNGKLVPNKIKPTDVIGRAVNAATIHENLMNESGCLKEEANELFHRHFRRLQKMFPGLEVGEIHSDAFNKVLFKRKGGLNLDDNILGEFCRKFPSLRLTQVEVRYFASSRSSKGNKRKAENLSLVYKKKNKLLRGFNKYNLLRESVGMAPIEKMSQLPDGRRELEIV
jgi:hypothetical protein